jgi:hypothetical protein
VKLVPAFADRKCCVVKATDPHGRILHFLVRNRFQVAPQLYPRVWVDSIPDPLLLRKSGSARNRTRALWICSQELWPLGHRGGRIYWYTLQKIGIKKKHYHNSGRYPLSCFLFKTTFRTLDSISVFRSTQLVPIGRTSMYLPTPATGKRQKLALSIGP